jgi:acyl-CoA reductase-like NAD-dependent aldehyde dehydrogenase
MSVKAYVNGEPPNGRLTPPDVADLLERYADAGLRRVERLAPGSDKELRHTLGDIKATAWLGRYYAEKIRGAVDLHRYQKAGDRRDHQRARGHLQTAAANWKRYAELWSAQYAGQVLTRMGLTPVDIREIQTFVDRDIPTPLPAR